MAAFGPRDGRGATTRRRLALNAAARSDRESHGRHAHCRRAWEALRPALYPGLADNRLGHSQLAGPGKTEDQVIEDYPELEKDDFRAEYEYAAWMGRKDAPSY